MDWGRSAVLELLIGINKLSASSVFLSTDSIHCRISISCARGNYID